MKAFDFFLLTHVSFCLVFSFSYDSFISKHGWWWWCGVVRLLFGSRNQCVYWILSNCILINVSVAISICNLTSMLNSVLLPIRPQRNELYCHILSFFKTHRDDITELYFQGGVDIWPTLFLLMSMLRLLSFAKLPKLR